MQHYNLAVRQFERSLKTMDAVLDKAIKHAEARKFDPNNFCSMRLFPDMLPLLAQIRIACDTAKAAAANLSGKEAPRHEDNETTLAELRGRIARCLAYLGTFTRGGLRAHDAPDAGQAAQPGRQGADGGRVPVRPADPQLLFSPDDGLRPAPPRRGRARQARLPRSARTSSTPDADGCLPAAATRLSSYRRRGPQGGTAVARSEGRSLHPRPEPARREVRRCQTRIGMSLLCSQYLSVALPAWSGCAPPDEESSTSRLSGATERRSPPQPGAATQPRR